MQTSLSHPAPSAHADGDLTDTPSDDRLRGLTHNQLANRLRWLSWYAPGVFTAVMDYADFTDALAADTGHAVD